MLILYTGSRVREALGLKWEQVRLFSEGGSRHGSLTVIDGKSRNAQRTLDVTKEGAAMLKARKSAAIGFYVFMNRRGDGPLSVSTVESQHSKLRTQLKMSSDFVIRSLRHTMLTRLGEASPDPYLVMKIAGHSTIAVSQRYVHPSTAAQTEAFERLEALNVKMRAKDQDDADLHGLPTNSPTVESSILGSSE